MNDLSTTEAGSPCQSSDKFMIRSESGYTAEIYAYGAHVTSWKDPQKKEFLFLSKNAVFKQGTAIRGGIPVCFPQFANLGPCAKQHGFARTSTFNLLSANQSSVSFILHHAKDQHPDEYPFDFDLTVKVEITDNATLEQTLIVQNTSTTTPFQFTTALHTYFRLYDSIDHASIKGLKNVHYLDSLQNRKECIETDESIIFPHEVDRIYLNTSHNNDASIILCDGKDHSMHIMKSGFSDAVVWNPYIDKAKSLSDFGDEEYKDMVCIEVAQAGSGCIEVLPGEEWTGKQLLRIDV